MKISKNGYHYDYIPEINRQNAHRLRETALEQYYKNPNFCKTCQKVILVRPKQKVADAKRKTYCSRSCAATANNAGVKRNCKSSESSLCEACGCSINQEQKKNGRWTSYRFCKICGAIARKGKSSKRNQLPNLLHTFSLQELFDIKGRVATRTEITRNAKKVYDSSDKPKQCFLCGFLPVYQVCHKKAVSSFPGETLISEVNSLDNLVALCPNHHILFDMDLLPEEQKQKVMMG
jgi:hypothetical protein